MKYKAIVLDDDPQAGTLIATLLKSRKFEAHCYTDAESLLAEVFGAGLPLKDVPDLLVVDRQLKPNKMQGLEFINELARKDVPCEILLISGSLTNEDVEEALECGWGAWLPKPFTSNNYAAERMERLAEIGKRRRLHRMKGQHRTADLSRRERPVFLSYSHHNEKLATGLRRALETEHILVWYARDMLRAGDKFNPLIESAVNKARVFLPLITDSYVDSRSCARELEQFRHRMESDRQSQLLILPVLYKLSPDKRGDRVVRPIFKKYHHLDISSQSAERLPELSSRIQHFLGGKDLTKKRPPTGQALPVPPERIAKL